MSHTVTDHLSATRRRLIQEIQLLSYEQLNRKPDSATWSVAQICHHIYLTERAFTQAIIYGFNKKDGKKAEQKPIQLAADRSQKVSAPPMVIPSEEPFTKEDLLELLNESRSIFLEFYRLVDDKSALAEKSAKHPLFGYLPLNQWVELLYLHEERHIEQIKEVKTVIA